MDVRGLKESFAHVTMHGDEVALFFYSDLFLRAPEVRNLFPVSMAGQRDRLLQALGTIVSDVDNLDSLVPFLRGLGRDHRKFGALAEHYDTVGASLLATLAHFSGSNWTDELEADWRAAYALVAQVMIDAAKEDEDLHPPWWDATVISHERRSFDYAIFRVAPSQQLDYAPGQSVAVESADYPRTWRFYSMANAPREDGTLDFHVRMVDGGMLSSVLTRRAGPGSRLRLGPPVGGLVLDTSSQRDILMVAGSTGLAPLKAMIEQISQMADPPRVHLFFGARSVDGLYDLASLEKMAAEFGWLTVTHAVSGEPEDPRYAGERGTITDVMSRHGSWQGHDAYVCGSAAMVEATVGRLGVLGMSRDQIHVEDFGGSN